MYREFLKTLCLFFLVEHLESYVIIHGYNEIAITHNNEFLGHSFFDELLCKLELDHNFSQSLLSPNIDDITKTKTKSPK